MYKVIFDKKVLKDLKKIGTKEQVKILNEIETKLSIDPYIGKRLVGKLSDFYRYRVGNYRVIYLIYEKVIEIEIIKIGHIKDIYDKL